MSIMSSIPSRPSGHRERSSRTIRKVKALRAPCSLERRKIALRILKLNCTVVIAHLGLNTGSHVRLGSLTRKKANSSMSNIGAVQRDSLSEVQGRCKHERFCGLSICDDDEFAM